MTYEQKPDTGSLFKNDRREKETHPHATGSALIDGVEYWVNAWTNEASDGRKYQSLKFKRKTPREVGLVDDEPAPKYSSYSDASKGGEPDLDDSKIPF